MAALGLSITLLVCSAPREYYFGQDAVRIDDRGVVSVVRDGQVRVASMHLWLAGPEWRSVDQRTAVMDQVAAHDRDEWFTFRMTEPVSGKDWQFVEKVHPVAAGIEISWIARPLAEMEVNELSLIVVLPIQAWHGKIALLWPIQETTLPEQQPAQRHFASGKCRVVVLDPGRDQISLRPEKPRGFTLQDTREFEADVYQIFMHLLPSGSHHVRPGEEYSAAVTLLVGDTEKYELVRPAPLTAGGDLAIRKVTVSAPKVAQYSKLELGVDLSATYDNPFDPEQVEVGAIFRGPDGSLTEVPGFFYQGFRRELLDGVCVLTPEADAGWRVRFTPTKPGRYTFSVLARDRSGETQWRTAAFECVASRASGFVRRSRDSRYFCFDDGFPYFPIGENLCWYSTPARTFDCDRWLARLHEAGANYIRLWMPAWAFGIEWEKPGVYRLDRAWELDYVLAACERLGIRVKLCLENFRTFGDGPNPYDVRNGGPCETVMDFFTKPEAKEMFKRRLRYIVARWAYSPAIMAWELWNEIVNVEGYWQHKSDVVAWTAEMARYLREIDPYKHLTVNSLGSNYTEPELWRLDEMDFAQMRGYYGWSGTDETRDMAAFVAKMLGLVSGYGKPYMFAEFGIIREFPEPRELCDRDREGVHLHNGQWAAAMSGACGGAMLWWWDSYVDPYNLYSRFTSLARFAADVPWTKAKLEPTTLAAKPERLRVLALRGPGRVLFWAQNSRHTWWNVVQGETIQPVRDARVTIRGLGRGTYRLRVYDTWACRYVVDRQVSPAAGNLEIPLGDVPRDVAVKVELVR